MGYNIDHSEYVSGELSIKRHDAQIFAGENKDDLPEGNMLEGLDLSVNKNPEEILAIKLPWWYGEGSGHAYENLLPGLLRRTRGKATILFVWEGGDSQTALIVDDGVVKKGKVKVVVEAEA